MSPKGYIYTFETRQQEGNPAVKAQPNQCAELIPLWQTLLGISRKKKQYIFFLFVVQPTKTNESKCHQSLATGGVVLVTFAFVGVRMHMIHKKLFKY